MKLSERILDYYEDRTKTFLMRKMITIIRLDGKGFSKLTKPLNKPFDTDFSDDMDATAVYLCENIQGIKFAYTQSDEITLVLTDFDNNESQAWYDYNVQKMTSISASLATAKFNQLRSLRKIQAISGTGISCASEFSSYQLATFDSRVFQVPSVDEMVNTLLWRQQDCTRNSISMAADALYPHKLLEGKSGSEKQDLLMEKGVNWNNYQTKFKRGSVIKKEKVIINGQNGEPIERNKWLSDKNTPIFSQNKEYLIDLIVNKELV